MTSPDPSESLQLPFGPHLKTLMWLLLANLILIGILGLVLVMMSHETAHFLLSLAISLCAGAVVVVTGYLCYQMLSIGNQQRYIYQGLDILPVGIFITADNKVVYANQQLSRHFGHIHDNFLHEFANEFVAADSKNQFVKLLQQSQRGHSDQEQIVMTSHILPTTSWCVEVMPLSLEDSAQLWVFHPQTHPSNLEGFQFLQASENFRCLFEASPMGVVLLGDQGQIVSSNRFFREETIKGLSFSPQSTFESLVSEDYRGEVQKAFTQLMQGHTLSMPIELTFRKHEDQAISVFATRIQNPELESTRKRSVSGLILHLFDDSAQKHLQLQLVQSQKMQAMGQLAGGIAHDFNNLLTAMVGFCDLLLSRHSPGDQSFTDIMQIKQNANRAANLVRQLLAFSKQQTLQPQILDVKETLAEVSTLLRRLVSVDVKITMSHASDLGLIKVDKGQFEQVMINFVVNARDAMNDKGQIKVNTFEKVYQQSTQENQEKIPPGHYVVIEISDAGCGIDPENMTRIFDPFFSTKEIGKGTGLGLSMAYGIVKQTGGHIFVESTQGQGTKFTILFPRFERPENFNSKESKDKRDSFGDLTGTETILFVEDEDPVRLFGVRALRDKGYKVIEAASGKEAIAKTKEFLSTDQGNIDLMISDVVMPEMDGPTLTKKIHEFIPGLQVVYISGYAEDSFRSKVGQGKDILFLSKPFSLKELAIKVKLALKKDLPEGTQVSMQQTSDVNLTGPTLQG